MVDRWYYEFAQPDGEDLDLIWGWRPVCRIFDRNESSSAEVARCYDALIAEKIINVMNQTETGRTK